MVQYLLIVIAFFPVPPWWLIFFYISLYSFILFEKHWSPSASKKRKKRRKAEWSESGRNPGFCLVDSKRRSSENANIISLLQTIANRVYRTNHGFSRIWERLRGGPENLGVWFSSSRCCPSREWLRHRPPRARQSLRSRSSRWWTLCFRWSTRRRYCCMLIWMLSKCLQQSSSEARGWPFHQAWSLETYDLVVSVHAHRESVLGLYLSEDGNLLFSSGGDSVVNVSHSNEEPHEPGLMTRIGVVHANIWTSLLDLFTPRCGRHIYSSLFIG